MVGKCNMLRARYCFICSDQNKEKCSFKRIKSTAHHLHSNAELKKVKDVRNSGTSSEMKHWLEI
jgi:hypothetical protein